MHPSQMSIFRKGIITLLTLTFAGALLVFTAQANLTLLQSVYPDPKFYMFGLLALEGGVIYWTGFYLLHPGGGHKAISLFSLAVDAIISGIGFFYEMERMTDSVGTVQLPPVVVIVGFAVVFNVGMSIISHLLPTSGGDFSPAPHTPAPKEPERYYVEAGSFEQTAELPAAPRRPGALKNLVANVIAGTGDTLELAAERREQLRQARRQAPPPQVTAPEVPPTTIQEEPEVPPAKKA